MRNKKGATHAIDRAVTVFLFFFLALNSSAQNIINIDASFGLRLPVSNDVLKRYTTNPPYVMIEYFSRKKFSYPYFNLLADFSYGIGKKLKLGLQSGIYVHYREIYGSSTKRTTITAPLQLTVKYPVLAVKNKTIGVYAAAGVLFFSLDEFYEKYRNSALTNLSIFYKTKNGGLLKLGIEKQTDFVTVNLKNISQYVVEETFKYSLNRLSLALSYGVVIK